MVQLCPFWSPNKTNHDLNFGEYIAHPNCDVLKVSFSTNLNIIIIADRQSWSRVMNLCQS